jgi:Uma2 family endonuclease
MEAVKLHDQYLTYADYVKLDDDIRYELIDGVLYNMAAPTVHHQEIVLEVAGQLREFLKGKSCKVYISPIDVRLNYDKDDDAAVQPDIIVVCNRSKIDPKGHSINGAPDMVVEVLSPSSAYRDRLLKSKKYLQAGVREYWIVDPRDKIVQVCILKNGEYAMNTYGDTDNIPVHVLEGCTINIAAAFAEE